MHRSARTREDEGAMLARLESGRGPICHKCVELEEYVGGSESVVLVFGRSFDGDGNFPLGARAS